jgi:hypothetical protein
MFSHATAKDWQELTKNCTNEALQAARELVEKLQRNA